MRALLTSLLCCAAIGCNRGKPQTYPPPPWTAPSTAPGVVRIVICRASDAVAWQRLQNLAVPDAERALHDAVVAGMNERRKTAFVDLSDADFTALRRSVSDAAAQAASSLQTLKRDCVLMVHGERPDVPGNDMYCAFLLAEIPRAQIKSCALAAIPQARATAFDEIFEQITFLVGGEPHHLKR